MPLLVADLKLNDRVLLNCPKSQIATHRQAVFQGVFESLPEAMAESLRRGSIGIEYLPCSATPEFLNGRHWARFLMGTLGNTELIGAFAIQPDGTLKDETGRSIFIERRVFAGAG